MLHKTKRERRRDTRIAFDDVGVVPNGECGVWLAKIKEALASGDLEAARLAAHGLRGMAGNFAALRIAAIAGQIEFESQTVEEAEWKSSKLETAIRDTRCWMENAA